MTPTITGALSHGIGCGCGGIDVMCGALPQKPWSPHAVRRLCTRVVRRARNLRSWG
ncbi:Hypothetical protein CAP_5908 [Chondromyces apiculatus DSM 436]|uniref:Uncharacterized protein n=1 Tax=Chondromyces apiculatus DSM 436 TaxID=1192034 RepID=A0A017TFT7_9BACT|nr:Hypothetical protein CAP_5908 [Chondromyces apiculatus DSM 436]